VSTELVDDRDTALAVGYVATDWTHVVPFDAYCEALEPCRVQAIVRNQQCIGALYRLGDEVHVSVLPDYRRRWASKGLLKQIFSGARVTTRVVPGHEYMYDILTRLGFVQMPDGLFVKGH
jgi:hypothetical protein